MNKIMSNQETKQVRPCVICGEKFEGFGNDPSPIKSHGECCDECNSMYVIPKRISILLGGKK